MYTMKENECHYLALMDDVSLSGGSGEWAGL